MSQHSECAVTSANTAYKQCGAERKTPVQLIFGSASFAAGTYSTTAALKTAIIDNIKQAIGTSDKLFPLPVILDVKDATVSAKKASFGLGLEIQVQRAKQGYDFLIKSNSDLEKELIKFDGKIIPTLIFDDHNQLWGKFDTDLNFEGADYMVNVTPKGYDDGNGAFSTMVSIRLIDSRDFVENAAMAKIEFASDDLVGLLSVNLAYVSHSTNVHKISMKAAGVDINNPYSVGPLYGTEIAALIANFSAKSGAGTPTTSLAITSITYNSSEDVLVVTYDNTAYGTATGNIKLIPPNPTQLDGGDVAETELIAVTYAKP